MKDVTVDLDLCLLGVLHKVYAVLFYLLTDFCFLWIVELCRKDGAVYTGNGLSLFHVFDKTDQSMLEIK